MKEDKARIEAAFKAVRRNSKDGGHQYVLSSLRYWDVSLSPTKRYTVGRHFVPSVKNAALPFFMKKRRITIELYTPVMSPDIEVDAYNQEQTKILFGELLTGISSSSLMPVSAMGDNDMASFRILKPKPGGNEDDNNADAHSVGSFSISTLGFGSTMEEIDFDSKSIRWKERLKCRLDSLEIISQHGRSCDVQLTSSSGPIVKTIEFDSNHGYQSFIKVLDQMNKLREDRGRRLANTYMELRLTPPRSSRKSYPPTSQASPSTKSPGRPSPKVSPKYSPPYIRESVDADGNPVGSRAKKGLESAEVALGYEPHEVKRNLNDNFTPADVEEPFDNTIKILVEIVSASNLPVADIFSSDPYVKVYDGANEIHRTKVISKSLNPVWTVGTGSLFLIETTIESFFDGSNFISFHIKDYDAFKKNNTLGTVDISKDDMLQGKGERKVFDIKNTGRHELKRRKSAGSSSLALRFRPPTPDDVIFMDEMMENEKRSRSGVHAAESFLAPRDHHVSIMKKKTRKGHNHSKEYRVKPFADPDRKLETAWMTEKELDVESRKPSKYWIESGTGDIGKVYVEILGCDKLPNMDISLTGRDKTDAFICMVYEDSIMNTDIISDCLSPRWMPWAQRAFVLNILHPSSQLMLGVFDYDSGFTEAGHDAIGRAVINLSNLCPGVLYTKIYELHRSPWHGRMPRGSITLRLRLEFPDARKALLAGARPISSYDVSVVEKQYFRVVHHTITHGEHSSFLSLNFISSYIEELKSYLDALFYVQPAVATVLLWRGHYPISFRLPCPPVRKTDDTKNCWNRWTRQLTLKLPLHSMTLFGWGIALARDFDLFPAFLVFSIGWFLLSSLEVASKRPSALYRPRSYLELMSVLLLGTSAGTRKIKPNENLDKIKEYEAEQAEMRRVRDEILNTIEMEQKKYEAYLEAQTSNLNEEVDMATKARGGGITSFTLAPFRGILLPIQHLLHDVCVGLRITTSIVVWRDSYVSFWIVTACFVASFVLLWIPWTFLIKWTFKISVWLFLGPWMKLVDICYFRREYDAEQKKEDLAEEFNERYQALVGESLFLKMRKETALKLKDMKKYMFGQYLMRVPVFKEERFPDDPIPSSYAEPFDRSKFGKINVIERMQGQLLEGEMIPHRRTNITVKEVVENGTVGSSDDDLTDPGFDDQDEAEPLLMPKLEADYGSMGKKAKKPKKRGWSPKRGALFHRG